MKHLLLLLAIVGIMNTCAPRQVAGTVDDVGSISGQILNDGKVVEDTVEVSLYEDDSAVGLAKTTSVKRTPKFTQRSGNGKYKFDELDAGTYCVEVARESIVIGKETAISLAKGKSIEVNISVVIIINQTFNIWTDNSQNTTINNFFIDNGTIQKTDSGFVLSSAAADTTYFKVEISRAGVIELISARIVRHADGTSSFELINAPADVVITAGTTPADGFLGTLSIGIGAPGTLNVESSFDTGSVPRKSK